MDEGRGTEVETGREPLRFWHGGRGWTGPAELRPARRGRSEAGPGVYMTTRYATARKYARGGGATYLVEVDPDIALAQDVEIGLDDALSFLKSVPRLRGRDAIAADLAYHCGRLGRPTLKAVVLVNLFVNHEVGTGSSGVALARFLTARGVHASLERPTGDERWLVVFDVARIRRARAVPAAAVTAEMRELDVTRLIQRGRKVEAEAEAEQDQVPAFAP